MKLRSWLFIALMPVLAGCGTRTVIPRDRYGLGQQSDVYIVHHTAVQSFTIVQKGDRGAGGIIGGTASAIAIMANRYNATRLQQRLDLEDPVLHVKAQVTEVLRDELKLTNLRVLPEVSDLIVLPKSKYDEKFEIPVERAGTFNEKHPTGMVIELTTEHWGMNDYRIMYYASVRLVDLSTSRILLDTNCPWAVIAPIDTEKLFFEAGQGMAPDDRDARYDTYKERAEGRLFAENGALLKASLREAAERCGRAMVSRFLGRLDRRLSE